MVWAVLDRLGYYPTLFWDLSDSFMAKFAGFLVVLILAVVAGGGLYLAFWDIPPPSAEVVRTLPDNQFPR